MDQGSNTDRSATTGTTRSTRQGNGGRAGSAGGGAGQSATGGTGGVASQIGDVAQHAGAEVRDAASSLASMATDQVRRLADQQVSVGADMVLHVANAVWAAADNLDATVPQLSGVVRGAAERLEEASETIREQSAGELLRTTSDFARRHPSVVFGAAAAVGFLAYRLLTAGSDQDYADGGDYDEEDWEEFAPSAGMATGETLSGMSGDADIPALPQNSGVQVHGS